MGEFFLQENINANKLLKVPTKMEVKRWIFTMKEEMSGAKRINFEVLEYL